LTDKERQAMEENGRRESERDEGKRERKTEGGENRRDAPEIRAENGRLQRKVQGFGP
jgi:hypothetical protein